MTSDSPESEQFKTDGFAVTLPDSSVTEHPVYSAGEEYTISLLIKLNNAELE